MNWPKAKLTEIKRLYLEDLQSCEHIANLFNCTSPTITATLRAQNIVIRSAKEQRSIGDKRDGRMTTGRRK